MTSYSQANEYIVLSDLFTRIGTTNRTSVEFGARDGYLHSNTRLFIEKGWTGHQWDCNPSKDVKGEFITAENVNEVFKRHKVPDEFDLLSIDIDGNDLWVWKALNYNPRVLIIEFNPFLKGSKTIPYDPVFKWDKTRFFGASADALCKISKQKGYKLTAQVANNLVFCLESIDNIMEISPEVTGRSGHPPDHLNRRFMDV